MESKKGISTRDRAHIEPAALSDEQRQQTGLLFLRLRNAFPQTMQQGGESKVWRFAAETVLAGEFDAAPRATDGELLSLDQAGAAFNERANALAKAGLPLGSDRPATMPDEREAAVERMAAEPCEAEGGAR